MNTSIRSIPRADVALFVLRATAAAAFFFHGGQKLFGWFGSGGLPEFASYLARLGAPLPHASALLAAVSEFVGAAILLSGRGFLGLVPLVFTMGVAVVTSGRNGFDVQRGGIEYPLTLAAVLVALLLLGPGSIVAARSERATDAALVSR